VTNNTCFNNTERDIYFFDSDSNIVIYDSDAIPEMIGAFVPVVLLLIGLVGITLLSKGLWKVYARGGHDDIIIPIRHRIVSWFRKRRASKHTDTDKSLEPDSSEQ